MRGVVYRGGAVWCRAMTWRWNMKAYDEHLRRVCSAAQDLLSAMRAYMAQRDAEIVTGEIHALNVALARAGFTPIFPTSAAFERMVQHNRDAAAIGGR
jgi:hypothetical protein